MGESKEVREAVRNLLDNLGTIGTFMLGEVRVLLRKSWGASKEEFFAALDQTARNMKQSGKWAADDVRRAAEQIRDNWELLDRWRGLDRDAFLDDLKSRLNTVGELTRETYDRAIEQSRKALDKQWERTGRIGEEHLEALQKHSEDLASSLREQWGVFWDHMEKTGKKIDRAVNAAWEELKKKDK